MKTTHPRCIGSSRDERTNRWRVECPSCGKSFEPMTTRLAYQIVECPKRSCGKELALKYNDDPPTCSVIPDNREDTPQP